VTEAHVNHATRHASAAARRAQIGQMRADVRTHLAQSHQRREDLAQVLGRLREGLLDIRTQVRERLRQIGIDKARRRTR
jgi:hypothetical protein